MNYKLAKQLKDAGFPQNCKKQYSFLEGPQEYSLQNKGDLYYECDAPDLFELIDATKQKGRELELTENKQWWGLMLDKKTNDYKLNKKGEFVKKLLKDYHWVAKMIDWDSKKYGNCSCYESGDEIVARTEGETPVVAMAELWLKLNEKK